jgi:hypothetical protein
MKKNRTEDLRLSVCLEIMQELNPKLFQTDPDEYNRRLNIIHKWFNNNLKSLELSKTRSRAGEKAYAKKKKAKKK